MDTDLIDQQIQQIQLKANQGNQLVTVLSIPIEWEIVGVGTDAVVVRHPQIPSSVWKVYADERLDKKEAEYQVYQRLGTSRYFATCYEQGDRFLRLSYEKGPTLYQCLEEGIEIPEQIIDDVNAARQYAREKGLNPRDIHLKNVLLQDGRAKLIDVSEYMKPGNDRRWEYLVLGYRHFYSLIRGKKVPTWLIELVKNAYENQKSDQFSVIDFCQKFVHMFGLDKKN